MPRFSLDEKQHPSITPCLLLRNSCVWRLQVFFWLYIGSYLWCVFPNFESSVAIILQPMDVIKTKQQGLFHTATLQNSTELKTVKDMRWQTSAKAIYEERGILGFWDGLVSFLNSTLNVVPKFDSRDVWRWTLLLSSPCFPPRWNQWKTVSAQSCIFDLQQH